MHIAAGPRLAAAVTNAGGIGVIGGLLLTPKVLQESIEALKASLNDKDAPFGVDLAIPQVGGTARKTNVWPSSVVAHWEKRLSVLPISTITPKENSRSSQI